MCPPLNVDHLQKTFKSAGRYTVHPPMYVMYPEDCAHRYQLRAYMYLAKDMQSGDSSGLSGIEIVQCLWCNEFTNSLVFVSSQTPMALCPL